MDVPYANPKSAPMAGAAAICASTTAILSTMFDTPLVYI